MQGWDIFGEVEINKYPSPSVDKHVLAESKYLMAIARRSSIRH